MWNIGIKLILQQTTNSTNNETQNGSNNRRKTTDTASLEALFEVKKMNKLHIFDSVKKKK